MTSCAVPTSVPFHAPLPCPSPAVPCSDTGEIYSVYARPKGNTNASSDDSDDDVVAVVSPSTDLRPQAAGAGGPGANPNPAPKGTSRGGSSRALIPREGSRRVVAHRHSVGHVPSASSAGMAPGSSVGSAAGAASGTVAVVAPTPSAVAGQASPLTTTVSSTMAMAGLAGAVALHAEGNDGPGLKMTQ